MFGRRPLVSSLRGMVAAAHPQAAVAGARTLRAGGNAFDAAVATAAALNVVEPFMSGLAGLGMATAWIARERRVRCLDFITASPLSLPPDGLRKEEIFRGPRAVAPPGSLAAWAALAADHGTLPLARLLEPAIELASEGVPVTEGLPSLTRDWFDLRSNEPEWVRVYTDGSGDLRPGWVLRQPDLAATLQAIAADGPDHLYAGPLGERMTAHIQERGGFLSMRDLARVAPTWRDPLAVDYRGMAVHTLPPPAESFQYLLTLGALHGLEIGAMTPQSVDHLDAMFRAVRLCGELRVRNNHAPRERIEELLDADHLAALTQRVRDGRPVQGRTQRWRPITDPALIGLHEHTTSFSTADASGNMVCITQSLGSIYGSGVVIPGTGVCLNNFLNWGDLEHDSPNRLRAGRPLAMCLAPSVATRDGEPVLALGTPGSYGILQTQAQVMVQHLDFGLGLQDAIEAPRGRVWDGSRVQVEGRIDADTAAALRSRGHDLEVVAPWTLKVGGVQGIARDPLTGVLTGAADPRRDGYAVPA